MQSISHPIGSETAHPLRPVAQGSRPCVGRREVLIAPSRIRPAELRISSTRPAPRRSAPAARIVTVNRLAVARLTFGGHAG